MFAFVSFYHNQRFIKPNHNKRPAYVAIVVCLWHEVAPENAATTTNDKHRQRQQQQQQQQLQRQQLGSNCFYTMPGLCSTDTVEFFRIVRLVYIKPTSSQVADINVELPAIVYPINYETFVPDLVQRQEHASICSTSSLTARFHIDKMRDTFAKAAAFLLRSGSPIDL